VRAGGAGRSGARGGDGGDGPAHRPARPPPLADAHGRPQRAARAAAPAALLAAARRCRASACLPGRRPMRPVTQRWRTGPGMLCHTLPRAAHAAKRRACCERSAGHLHGEERTGALICKTGRARRCPAQVAPRGAHRRQDTCSVEGCRCGLSVRTLRAQAQLEAALRRRRCVGRGGRGARAQACRAAARPGAAGRV